MSGTSRPIAVALLVVISFGSVGLGAASNGSSASSSSYQQDGDDSGVTVPENRTEGPFLVTTDNVKICGVTCRQVSVTLSNPGNVTAENVTVESVVTAGDEVLVQRQDRFGTLNPNESITRVIEVNAGLDTLNEIREAGGQITVRTQVTSEQYNQTFVGQRQVA